jgi:SIR2-like domain
MIPYGGGTVPLLEGLDTSWAPFFAGGPRITRCSEGEKARPVVENQLASLFNRELEQFCGGSATNEGASTEPLVPPYEVIDDGLRSGTVIPFLGAGASLGCRLAGTAADDPTTLPTGWELSQRLAKKTSFPKGSDPDLATVAQYFEVVSGRGDLHGALRDVFARDYEPGRLHRYLASIASPLLIVTTNYDDLIERALRDAGKAFGLVIHTTDAAARERLLWWPDGAREPESVLAKKLYIDLESTTVVYKMHGAVDRALGERDQYVVTEDDYVDFLSRLLKKKAVPAIFAEPFQKRRFLFLGYGLRDWNLRVVLNRVDRNVRGTRVPLSGATNAKPSALETRLWQSRGVEIYAMAIETFLDGVGG